MAKYDSIIFDLDGTLWNASIACAKGWNAALAKHGRNDIVISPQDMKLVAGKPFMDCVRTLIPGISAEFHADLIEAIDSGEKNTVEAEGGIAFEGVIDGIRDLAEWCPLFLVSNCQDWYLAAFWKHIAVASFFRASDCHGRSGVSKAEMIRSMATEYELLSPIYIGDTEGDERASRSAEVGFGHVEYGFGKARSPDVKFQSFSAIVDWYARQTTA